MSQAQYEQTVAAEYELVNHRGKRASEEVLVYTSGTSQALDCDFQKGNKDGTNSTKQRNDI